MKNEFPCINCWGYTDHRVTVINKEDECPITNKVKYWKKLTCRKCGCVSWLTVKDNEIHNQRRI